MVKGCVSSVGPPALNPINFPEYVVYLPPLDDKLPNLDFGGRGEDIAYS